MPRGGPPIAAALSGSGAGREAPDDGSPGVPGGGPDWSGGTLPADGVGSEIAIASRPSSSHLKATWQTSVGRCADAGGGHRPRGGGLTSTGDVAACGWPEAGRRWRAWAARWTLYSYCDVG